MPFKLSFNLASFVTPSSLVLGLYRLDEGLDVAYAKSVGAMPPGRIQIRVRYMIRYQHTVITHFFVGAHSLCHINITLIGKGLLKL